MATIEMIEKEILAMSDGELIEELFNYLPIGVELSFLMDEDVQDELKPPKWIKGYEALWWAAVARYVGEKDPDSVKGDGKAYGGVTMIFKAYLKRMTGYGVDEIKKENGSMKAGEVVAGAKKEMSAGMRSGSSSAASQVSKIGALNKALSELMQLKGKAFIAGVKEKIYNKHLKK